jgi:hypothetical protein
MFPDEFGGTHIVGESLVVFFTGNTEHHEQRLRGMVRSPSQLVVHRCSRSWRELSASMLRAKERLMDHPEIGVREIGFGLRRGVLAVRIRLAVVTPDMARKVIELAHPEEVYVDPVGTDH